jgi:hypothetical protein
MNGENKGSRELLCRAEALQNRLGRPASVQEVIFLFALKDQK